LKLMIGAGQPKGQIGNYRGCPGDVDRVDEPFPAGKTVIEITRLLRIAEDPAKMQMPYPGETDRFPGTHKRMGNAGCVVAHHEGVADRRTPPERFAAHSRFQFVIVDPYGRVTPVEGPPGIGTEAERSVDYVPYPFGDITDPPLAVGEDEPGVQEVLILLPYHMGLDRNRKVVGGEPDATHPFGIHPFSVPGGLVVLAVGQTGVVSGAQENRMKSGLQAQWESARQESDGTSDRPVPPSGQVGDIGHHPVIALQGEGAVYRGDSLRVVQKQLKTKLLILELTDRQGLRIGTAGEKKQRNCQDHEQEDQSDRQGDGNTRPAHGTAIRAIPGSETPATPGAVPRI